MTDHSEVNQSDLKAHTATYLGVMSLLKWAAVVSFVVVAIVVLLLAS
jgi:hypothetical protein